MTVISTPILLGIYMIVYELINQGLFASIAGFRIPRSTIQFKAVRDRKQSLEWLDVTDQPNFEG